MAPYSMAGLLLAPQERVSATWSASYHPAEETSRFILSTDPVRDAVLGLIDGMSSRIHSFRVVAAHGRSSESPSVDLSDLLDSCTNAGATSNGGASCARVAVDESVAATAAPPRVSGWLRCPPWQIARRLPSDRNG